MKNLFYIIWPPFEARCADNYMKEQDQASSVSARWSNMLLEVNGSLPLEESLVEEVGKRASRIEESESKRKETIENKATTFISSVGVVITIISVVPALFSSQWQLPHNYALIAGVSYLLAIVFMLVSIYYAIKVRRVSGMMLPCYDRLMDALRNDRISTKHRISEIMASVKWNENILTRKANYLSVAEELFLRGLALVSFAVVVSLSAKLFNLG